MSHTKIKLIELWFQEEKWCKGKQQVEKEEAEYPRKFFRHLIPHFWSFLSLLDVINLAYTYKTAAYTAYKMNINGFGDFCDYMWKKGILDLRKFPQINSKMLKQLSRMYLIRETIFTADMPTDCLDAIPWFGTNFTFYIDNPSVRLMRAVRPFPNKCELKIRGEWCTRMIDPTIDILFTFTNLSTLTLEQIYFTEHSIAALKLVKIKELILRKCTIAIHRNIDFVQALLNSSKTLEAITIDTSDIWYWPNIVHYFNEKIHLFKKLKFYSVSLSLKYTKLGSFRKTKLSRSLKHLHIVNMINEYEQHNYNNYENFTEAKEMRITIERKVLHDTDDEEYFVN